MKKIILVLFAIFFSTNIFAHSTKGHTPNLDSKKECTKKKSALNFIFHLNNPFNPFSDASQTPFSVIKPVTYLAGVTSKAMFIALLF